jgi:ABC-type branched-subunit amino acid transport system ATPase component
VSLSPLLTFEGVTAGYGKLTVLQELTLELGAGEVLAVLGANGSGKSTVLKTAMGLTRLTAGSLHLQSADITYLQPHSRAALGIGYVPQTRNVFPELSVLDNLRMGGYLHAPSVNSGIARLYDLFPSLRERQHNRARDLSGGERRMLSIGLTLLSRPKVLLLDEPSSDLSPGMVTSVFDALQRIKAESRIPLLLVEQNVRAAMSIADRVCVMVRGRKALDVAVDQVDLSQLHHLFLDGSVRIGNDRV